MIIVESQYQIEKPNQTRSYRGRKKSRVSAWQKATSCYRPEQLSCREKGITTNHKLISMSSSPLTPTLTVVRQQLLPNIVDVVCQDLITS
ncbi:hypothetical protein GWI33_019188 [Rhynchophorus ferrugineus]|uniref:Uncharacterized protein n=1 Tax=Rhynchophorus ferrugineus TaxID=354439 RepID=A0A834HTB1_RHYFE|nr:hypothetical protein GWI33_019188 [Rhynchophorus ferrugineus]